MGQVKKYARFYIPILFFILMLIDTHLTTFIEVLSKGFYVANAHFLLLAALCASKYLPRRYLIIVMIVLGLIYDCYYIGIIGIYAVALPLVVFFSYSMGNAIHMNVFTQFFGWVILITAYETYSLFIQLIFQFAQVNTVFFITRYLGPTLLLNILVFLLFIYPFNKVFEPERSGELN